MANKLGRQFKKATHQRYNSADKRKKNKMRRILRSNGEEYLDWWMKNVNGMTERAKSRGGIGTQRQRARGV